MTAKPSEVFLTMAISSGAAWISSAAECRSASPFFHPFAVVSRAVAVLIVDESAHRFGRTAG